MRKRVFLLKSMTVIVQKLFTFLHSFSFFFFVSCFFPMKISLHSHLHQRRPLHLAHDAVATDGPLLRDDARVDDVPHQTTSSPVLHERAGLVLGDALESENVAVLESIVDALVVAALVRVGSRHGATGLAGLELGDDELLRGMVQGVVLRGDGDDGTAVGQRGLAGEGVDKGADEGQVVGVDLVEVGVAVLADLVDVGEAVEGEEHGRAAGQRELRPQREKRRPRVLGLLGAEGEVGQRSALLDASEAGPVLLQLEVLKHRLVRLVDVLDQLQAVDGLGELHGLRLGHGRVFRVSICEILACSDI